MTNIDVFAEHYNRIVRDLKLIIDDDRLSDEEKIRLLGVIL